MSPVRTCPDCGAVLPPDAPRGLCPNCLIRAALARPAGDGPGADTELTVSLAPADPSTRRGPQGAGVLEAGSLPGRRPRPQRPGQAARARARRLACPLGRGGPATQMTSLGGRAPTARTKTILLANQGEGGKNYCTSSHDRTVAMRRLAAGPGADDLVREPP
jgi:hypothetical protein